MKDAHYTVAAAVLGSVMTTVALLELVPNGQWLYLAMLVGGSQVVAMAVRAATRSAE
jgi:hypothetical protein